MDAFRKWCTQVTNQVSFKADRDAIAKELTAHYEDHVRDLERLEFPRELAQQRTLEAMGDPELVGKALDRVHKPWLGWLWKVSRWLLAAACLFLIWTVMLRGVPDVQSWFWPSDHLELGPYGQALACPPDVEMGPYTLQTKVVWYVPGEKRDTLSLSMVSSTWCFWLEGPSLSDLEAVDSNGAHYTMYHRPYIIGSGPNTGHFRNALWIQVDGIENHPAWIEITHQTAGWTLHVDLPGGEEGTTP